MPVIYVCCFASAMRKQVNYHSLTSIYDPYGGKVRHLFVYQVWSRYLYPFKSYKGSQNFKIGSGDLGHADLGFILCPLCWKAPSSICVPYLKRIAWFARKL